MEKCEIKAWLDEIIETIKKQNQLRDLNENIASIPASDDAYLISKGIEIVADAMGLELVYEYKEDCEFMHRYTFEYKGVFFIQLEKNKLEIEVLTDAGAD